MKKITLLKYALSAFIALIFGTTITAQLQNTNWYFGDFAGLNFNDGTQAPTLLLDSNMNADGGSATVSDDTGNLLFYSNGVNVYNRNHQLMPNGSGLNANFEVSQSVVIVPDPSNVNKYYVFTNKGNEQMGSGGLFYSVVDLTLDGGLGDIEAATKNTMLHNDVSQKMTAVSNPGDNTYWFIALILDEDPEVDETFFSYKIDATGVSLANTSSFSFNLQITNDRPGGQMKISPDAQHLAVVQNTIQSNSTLVILSAEALHTFNFDNSTGAVSGINSSYLTSTDVLYGYGVEFSPDSNLLYLSTTHKIGTDPGGVGVEQFNGRIYQIDFKSLNTGPQTFLIYDGAFTPIYGLQAALNGKIYSVNPSGSLSTLNTPNIYGFGANYVHEDLALLPNYAIKELPQMVPEVFLGTTATNKAKKPVLQGNPFKDELKFRFTFIQDYTIEFYNSAGALAKTDVYDDMTNRKIYKVDTSDLPNDTYYLIIRDEQSQIWYETTVKIE